MGLHFENNIFKELIEKYPTWEEFKKYIESEEGGLLKIVDNTEDGLFGGLCIIRYEKGSSKMDLPHTKWFRSVVWNTKTNRPVSIAPSKTSSSEFPFKTINEVLDAGVVCQELLDGFMINCFRVEGDSTIYTTSRSKLGATGKFYSEKSFMNLFTEALNNTFPSPSSSEIIITDESGDLCMPDRSKGEIAKFWSYLVQHKEHRIVKPIEDNRVYLIHRGVVFEDGHIDFEDSPETLRHVPNIQNIKLESKPVRGSYAQVASLVIPKDGEKDISELNKWIQSYLSDQPWHFQGLVFKDKFGNRWRFRSEKYSAIKSLRGNSSDIRDRFSQLYTQNLINKYIEYYPEEMILLTVNLMIMNSIIKDMYDNYVDLHITKVKKSDDINKVYLPHLYRIHGMYLSQLRPNNLKVNVNEIQLYLHKQPWQRISFLIKKTIDNINSQS
jgi:hypothetical protein